MAYILRSLETEGEHHAASDVQQLQGLCERMDSEAFLPLSSDELTSNTGTRIVQYCEIVNEVTSKLVDARIASIGRLRATGGPGWYGRYMLVHNVLCFLYFSADLWARHLATPLWLRIGSNAEPKHRLKDALLNLELEQPLDSLLMETYFLSRYTCQPGLRSKK